MRLQVRILCGALKGVDMNKNRIFEGVVIALGSAVMAIQIVDKDVVGFLITCFVIVVLWSVD